MPSVNDKRELLALAPLDLAAGETPTIWCTDCAPCRCHGGNFCGIPVTAVGKRGDRKRCLWCGMAWTGGWLKGEPVEVEGSTASVHSRSEGFPRRVASPAGRGAA